MLGVAKKSKKEKRRRLRLERLGGFKKEVYLSKY